MMSALISTIALSFISQDPAALERVENEKAFREEYLPKKESLFERGAGKWLVIADGHLLLDTPVETIKDAEFLGRKCAPNAKHRFVFRIGEEGDVSYRLGGTADPFSVGGNFLAQVKDGCEIRFSGDQEGVYSGGKKISSSSIDKGLKIHPEVSPPLSEKGKEIEFLVATGFQGFLTLAQKEASSLSLELWEIPGTVHLEGVFQSGTARRARVKVKIPEVQEEFTVPVAVWMKG